MKECKFFAIVYERLKTSSLDKKCRFHRTLNLYTFLSTACIRIGDAKKVTQVEMLPEEQLLIVLSSKIIEFSIPLLAFISFYFFFPSISFPFISFHPHWLYDD